MEQKYIIGDVIEYDNKIMIIKEPRDESHFDLLCPKEKVVYCFIDIDKIKPVRITPEILKKNGWMYYTHCDLERIYSKDYEGISIYIGVYEDGDEYAAYAYNGINDYDSADDYYLRCVNYVHKLQHLLFGLGLNSEMEV